MSPKSEAYLFAFIGSTIGGIIPTFWGAGFLSISSLVFSTIGGIVGVIIAVKLTY